jgi:hypothetical protein
VLASLGHGTSGLDALATALLNDPSAGIAFGSVIPADHDPRQGFIVGYVPTEQRRLTGRLGKLRDGGIGANMALRREAVEAVGGFDEFLGAGGFFPSCEDGDMAYRVLKAGYALLHVPHARVVHWGIRDWSSGSGLTRRTYMAVGAAYMKHLRRGDAAAATLLLQQVWFGVSNLAGALIRGRRPFGFGRLLALASGCWRSFELEVDERGFYCRPRRRLSTEDRPGRLES